MHANVIFIASLVVFVYRISLSISSLERKPLEKRNSPTDLLWHYTLIIIIDEDTRRTRMSKKEEMNTGI